MLLEVKDLNIEFHDHLLPEKVVHHFEMQLFESEIVGIVGESGSGKSMTALAIAGLLHRKDMKKNGSIIYDGKNFLSCSRKELRKYQGNEIGIIFQEPMTSLNPVQTIGKQVEESIRIHTELTKEQRYQKVITGLKDVEIPQPEAVYKKYPHQLSGGMRQRVMIAAAMICEPKILIADEPTTALDVSTQHQITKLLKKLNREKKTSILFISHDLSLVEKLCDKIIVMENGYIVEKGTASEIFQTPKKDYTKRLLNAIPKLDITNL